MTLKEYIDNINVGMTAFGLLKKPLPFEYLRRKINAVRKYIALETRCLQCWNECYSEIGVSKYKKPPDCIKVLDVFYDGKPLQRKNNFEMNYKMQFSNEKGTPEYYSEYGGANQESGFIYLYPAPDAEKLIRIQTVQLPNDLTSLSSQCELPPILSYLVEEGIKVEILKDLGSYLYLARRSAFEQKVKENINVRDL